MGKSRSPKYKEAPTASRIVVYLATRGWDCYAEVDVKACGNVADLVAVRKPLLMVVEVKGYLSFGLLAQAQAWREYAHLVTAAIPAADAVRNRGRAFSVGVFADYGIGVLEVHAERVLELRRPSLLRRPPSLETLRQALAPEQRSYTRPGTNRGHWTAYKATRDEIRRVVEACPGIRLKQLINAINHHYRTDAIARCSIGRWIGEGLIEGIEERREGKIRRYYPSPSTSPSTK